MVTKKRSASSNRWLKEHWSDKYIKQTQRKGLRSRAWFKLNEIHQREKLFRFGMNVIDLGAAPGGWSQYVAMQIGNTGSIIACDILPMDPIPGVDFIRGDFCDPFVFQTLLERVGKKKIQVLLSDMSPNISGIPAVDIPKFIYLVQLAFNMCRDVLAPGGSFLVKVFQGEGFDEYLQEIHSLFTKVKIRKPDASRVRSKEVYILAVGRKL